MGRGQEIVLDASGDSAKIAPPPSSGAIGGSAWPPAPFRSSELTRGRSGGRFHLVYFSWNTWSLACLRMAMFLGTIRSMLSCGRDINRNTLA